MPAAVADGKWVTINGVHVLIGEDGTILQGPKEFVGKKPSDLGKAHRAYASAEEAHDSIKAHSQHPSESDKDQLSRYRGDGFYDLNDKLRNGDDLTGKAKLQADAVDRAVASGSLKESAVVYRGQPLSDSQLNQLKSISGTQKTFSDPAFLSTSSQASVAQKFSVSDMPKGTHSGIFQIESPAGTHVAHVNELLGESPGDGGTSGESELIFGRNTKLSVLDHRTESVGGKAVTVFRLRMHS